MKAEFERCARIDVRSWGQGADDALQILRGFMSQHPRFVEVSEEQDRYFGLAYLCAEMTWPDEQEEKELRERISKREKVLDELTATSQEMGLYDMEDFSMERSDD